MEVTKLLNPPQRIRFLTDSNECELCPVQPVGRAKLPSGTWLYEFTRSYTKMGLKTAYSLDSIQTMRDVKTIEILPGS